MGQGSTLQGEAQIYRCELRPRERSGQGEDESRTIAQTVSWMMALVWESGLPPKLSLDGAPTGFYTEAGVTVFLRLRRDMTR